MNYFDINQFNKKQHYLNTMIMQEKYGKYNIVIQVGDYIKFDEVVTNEFHSHTGYEICLVLDGTGVFRHGEAAYPLEKGTLFLADPYVTHEISSYQTKDLLIVFFSFDIQKNNSELSKKFEDNIIEDFLSSHHLVQYHAEILYHYLPLINNEFFNKELSTRLYSEYSALKAIIFEFIGLLTNKQTKEQVSFECNNKKINAVVRYINQNINTKLRVNELADKFYISERNLRRLFRKFYNKSVQQFIEERKMKIASSKLSMGFQVTEAARAIGIDDLSYFSRVFKKNFGVSPREYKKMH